MWVNCTLFSCRAACCALDDLWVGRIAPRARGTLCDSNRRPSNEKRPRRYAKGVSNATGRARTSNLRFRRPMLYPIELRSRVRLHCCSRRGDYSENITRRHGGDSCRDPRHLRTTSTGTEHRDAPILRVLKALLTSRPIVPRSPACQDPCAPRLRPRPSVDWQRTAGQCTQPQRSAR